MDRRHEQRADRACRVERRVRDRADGDDDRDDHETDHETGPALGRARVDDAEDREKQDRRAESLDEHRRAPGRRRMVEVDDAEPVAEIDGTGAEGRPHRERASDAADDLCAPVQRYFTPGEALRDGEAERHRRIDVAPGDLPDRVNHCDHDQTEGHRDEAEVGAREGRLRTALEQQDRGHGARPDENEQCRADRFGGGALRGRERFHHRAPFGPGRSARGPFRGFHERRRSGTSFGMIERRSRNVRHRSGICQGLNTKSLPASGQRPRHGPRSRRLVQPAAPAVAIPKPGVLTERPSAISVSAS